MGYMGTLLYCTLVYLLKADYIHAESIHEELSKDGCPGPRDE